MFGSRAPLAGFNHASLSIFESHKSGGPARRLPSASPFPQLGEQRKAADWPRPRTVFFEKRNHYHSDRLPRQNVTSRFNTLFRTFEELL